MEDVASGVGVTEESIHKLEIITCWEFSDRLDQPSVTVYENLVKQL